MVSYTDHSQSFFVVCEYFELFENRHYGHHTFADIALACLVGGGLQILDMHIEEPRPGRFEGLDNVDSSPHGMAHIHA